MHRTAIIMTAAAILIAAAAHATPKQIPAGSKLVYNFNLIGYPAGKVYDGSCGDGHRIFVNRAATKAQLVIRNGTEWAITDCNATADHQAALTSSQAGVLDLYVRILGKPGGTLHVCADTLADALAGEFLCQIGTLDLTRAKGQSKFNLVPMALFDASNIDILWSLDTNRDFRIVQFRVYERP